MDGDYAGLPLSAAGRLRAQSWTPENFDVPEWVCRPARVGLLGGSGAAQLRISARHRRPDAAAHRDSRASLDARAGDDDLYGWTAPPSGLCPSQLERLLDRRVGRRRARPDRHSPEGGLHPTVGADAKRRGDGAYPLQADRRLPARHRDHLRPRLSGRALHPDVAVLGASIPTSCCRRIPAKRRRKPSSSEARCRITCLERAGCPRRIRTKRINSARPTRRGSGGPKRCIPSTSRRCNPFPRPAAKAARCRGAWAMNRLLILASISAVAVLCAAWLPSSVSTRRPVRRAAQFGPPGPGSRRCPPAMTDRFTSCRSAASVYMLVGAGGNITVQAGDDGVLIVDAGVASMSDKVLAAIRTISRGPLRYIVNTDEREEFTGGNEKIAAAGSTIRFRVSTDPRVSDASGKGSGLRDLVSSPFSSGCPRRQERWRRASKRRGRTTPTRHHRRSSTSTTNPC